MDKEILSTEKAIHRVLFNTPFPDAKKKESITIRVQRHRWKNKILGAEAMERILLKNGYTMVESAKWIKNE